jgi:hypothetical protein
MHGRHRPPARSRLCAVVGGIALLAACAASPCEGRSLGERIRDLPNEQKFAVGAAIVDTGWTIECLQGRSCREVGPMSLIFGNRPSAAQVIGARMGTIVVSSIAVSLLQDRDPRAARTVARINLVLTGSTIGLHFARSF